MHALLAELPAYVGSLEGANIASGELEGTFRVWPTAHPGIKIERGQRFRFSLKVTTGLLDKQIVDRGAQYPDGRDRTSAVGANSSTNPSNPAPAAAGQQPVQLPADQVSHKVRREGSLSNYWIDFDVTGPDTSGTYKRIVSFPETPELAGLKIDLIVTVLDKTLIVVPDSLDAAEISIQALKGGEIDIGRVGVRTQEGELHIKRITSTIPFLKAEAQTIIADKNYLLHIRAFGDASVHPGSYNGKIVIETDDKNSPRAEVPIKVTLIP